MKKKFIAATAVAVIALSSIAVQRIYADDRQVEDMKNEIETLKKDVGEIKRALIAILPVLVKGDRADAQVAPEVRQDPQEGTVSIADGSSLGKASAPIVLVEFSDFECPFCAHFYRDTLSQIKKEYIDAGKLRFVYRDFPLPFHQNAMKATVAASCAGEQGKYWEMHDAIFNNQAILSDLEGIAKKAGVDAKLFTKCMTSGRKYEERTIKSLDEGKELGINGTPTFILGKLTPDGKVHGEMITGAMPYDVFKKRIDGLLQ